MWTSITFFFVKKTNLFSLSGRSFGQKPLPLVFTLKRILERYPDGGQILKVCSATMWILGKSSSNDRFVFDCHMVQYSNGGLKTELKKSLFMVQNVRYSNGSPSHMTTIWIPDTYTVQYSDESGVQYLDGYCTVKKPFNDQMMSLLENVICYTQACHSRVFKYYFP